MRAFTRCLIASSLLIGISLALASCGYPLMTSSNVRGSGTVKTEVRKVSHFDAITFSALGTVQIVQSGVEGVSVTAEDNFLPLLNTAIEGTTLDIHVQSGVNLHPTKPILFLVAVKQLNSITLSGVGTITAAKLAGSHLALALSGAGTMTLHNLTLTTLTATLSGAGSLTLTGQAQTQTVTLSGAGSYLAKDLATHNAAVTLSGTGSAAIRASDTLDVTITGAGSLTYYGNPTVTKHITGVGTVKQGGA